MYRDRTLPSNGFAPSAICFHITLSQSFSDFLVRLARMRIPQSLRKAKEKSDLTLIPDGLQHSRFTARRSGTATYVLCNREIVSNIVKGNLKSFGAHKVSAHSLLADQIGHLLRVRVLQELELLGDHMEAYAHKLSRNISSPSRILRRLTRHEWNAIRETGLIPYKDALAVLVVPPLQKNSITRKRPEPSMSTSPIVEEIPATPIRPPLAMSTLHLRANVDGQVSLEQDMLPQMQIPLYNGAALYPIRAQRAALHKLLNRLLGTEQRSRRYKSGPPEIEKHTIQPPESKRSSHAYLLCAGIETIEGGDAAAVAIALWRLRMFELGAEAQGDGGGE